MHTSTFALARKDTVTLNDKYTTFLSKQAQKNALFFRFRAISQTENTFPYKTLKTKHLQNLKTKDGASRTLFDQKSDFSTKTMPKKIRYTKQKSRNPQHISMWNEGGGTPRKRQKRSYF